MTAGWKQTIYLSAAVLAAAVGSASAAALDCSNPKDTPETNQCAAIEQRAAEAKLNQTYQRVLKSLDDGGKESAASKAKLVIAQRAWVKFREADCDAVFEKWAGGTIRTVMYLGCMQNHAEQRIKDLEDYAKTY
jgi:uncharacterized protein YecT (DUF1311 family)